MAKHHEITIEELQRSISETEIELASSTRERKRLLADLIGNMRVTVAGKTVWLGMQIYGAVEAYNAITEKYKEEKIDFKL